MKPQHKPKLKLLLALMLAIGWYTGSAQTLQVTDSSTSSCNNDGQVRVFVSGGTAPYSYTLAPYYSSSTFNQITQTSSTFTNIPPGSYTITVTDANGLNNALQPAYVYVNTRLYGYVSITPAVCPSNNGSETAGGYNGTGPYTYLWSNGSTGATITNVPIGSHYYCTVTDAGTGCSALASDSGGMYQTSSITTTMATTVANCSNGTATVTAANGQSPYTYLWSNGQTTALATGLSAGYPTVTVTDNQGCTAIGYAYITQGIVISTSTNTTAEHCNDGNGTVTVSALNGSAPFSYQWSTGNTTAHVTGLSAGYYSVVLTDHNGCTASTGVNVQKSTPIVLTTTATQTLCTSNTGSVTVSATGGTSPYTYVWNTSPPQTTAATTSTLGAGYYVVEVVDAVGCTQNQSASVTNNTTLAMSLTSTNPVCGGTAGTVDAHASGGSTPYTYLWNTSATTTNITGIHQAGYFSCQVTDHVGCTVNKYVDLELVSPVMLSLSSNNASCIYTADGTANASAVGGLAPYTFGWSNGQTGPAASGMLTGGYEAYVTDANGCSSEQWFYIGYNSIQPCAVSISGTVYDDHNGNCAVDGLDAGLQNVWVGCFPNGGYQWTNGSGNYNFTLPPGSYYLAETPPLYHNVVCPATPPTVTLAAGQSSPNYNFFNQPDSIIDLAINCIPYTQPVAGFQQQKMIFVGNLGTFTQNPDVVYMSSTDITFLGSTPAPDTYDPLTGRITWSGPLLAANGINTIYMLFNIPSPLPTGHILNNSDTVYPIVGDTSQYNNYEDVQETVVRAIDPNYIDVLPKGTGAPGYIATTDSMLRYVVHFQNTGTHAATYVTLKIPIDANLDISKFRMIGTSHPVTSVSADNNRMLTIRFDNINLPDSSVSRLGSQGFAAFTFQQKAGLAPLTPITEQANIYFDYNAAVPTNNVLNTIKGPNGIRSIENGALNVYPNPTTGNVTVDLSAITEPVKKITVYDVSGRSVIDMPISSSSANNRYTLNTSSLGSGVYIIEAVGDTKYIQKIVKTE